MTNLIELKAFKPKGLSRRTTLIIQISIFVFAAYVNFYLAKYAYKVISDYARRSNYIVSCFDEFGDLATEMSFKNALAEDLAQMQYTRILVTGDEDPSEEKLKCKVNEDNGQAKTTK